MCQASALWPSGPPCGPCRECSTSAIAFDMKLHLKGLWPHCRVPGDCGADHVPVLPRDQRHPCGDDALRLQGPLGLAAHVPRDPAGAPLASCFFFLVHKPAWPYFHWSYMSRISMLAGFTFYKWQCCGTDVSPETTGPGP